MEKIYDALVYKKMRAALGGNVRAMHNLATLLASGANGKPDYVTALRWYTEAAEAGFKDSQFNTGLLLTRGIGAKPNLPKAFQVFLTYPFALVALKDGLAALGRSEIPHLSRIPGVGPARQARIAAALELAIAHAEAAGDAETAGTGHEDPGQHLLVLGLQ